jgi:uncharacterized membrane protein
MPVSIDPKDEKVWKYMIERKVPITQEQVMKHFLISRSHVSRTLNFFVQQDIAEIIKLGSKKFYKVKE